jgi:hypothetical protein
VTPIWYRVEIASDGTVLSCEPTLGSKTDRARVFFVEASGREKATEVALRRYNARLRLERKATLISEGRCGWCSRKTDREPGKKCTKCLSREVERSAERRKIERGELTERTPRLSPNTERAAEQFRKLKIELLREVKAAWENAPNNASFTRWIEHNLSKLLAESPAQEAAA